MIFTSKLLVAGAPTYKQMTGQELSLAIQNSRDMKVYDELDFIGVSQRRDEPHFTLWVGSKLVADLELQINPYKKTQLWLMHIAVRTGYQGKGYARVLIDKACQWAVSNNFSSLKRSSPTEEGKIKIPGIMSDMQKKYPELEIIQSS